MNRMLPIVVVALLAGGCSKQDEEIERLKAEVTMLRAENEKLAGGGVAESEDAGLAGIAEETVALENATVASDEPGKKSALSGFASMMDNPVMRSQIEMQMKTQVEMTYGKLLEDQGFAGDEVDALSAILLERQMALTKIGMAAMGGEKADRKAAGEEAESIKKGYDDQLKELLGADNFAEMQRFEETQMERQQIDSLKSQLASTENALSDEQEQQLMDVMWEVREDPEFGKQLGVDLKGLSAGTSWPDDAGTMLDGMSGLHDEVRKRADFLSPEQMEALEKNQAGFLEMMKMGIEMSKQMAGGGNE